MFSTILYFITTHQLLGYLVIFLGMILEGDIILFTAAFLTHYGFFDPVKIIFVVVAGVILGDIIWYYLGIFAVKYPRINKWLDRITHLVDSHLEKSPFKTLFFSKFIYGLHHPILMRIGSKKMGLKKYLKSDIIASLIWIVIIAVLGYLFGASFFLVKKYIRYAELLFLAGVIIFFLFEKGLVSRKLEEKI